MSRDRGGESGNQPERVRRGSRPAQTDPRAGREDETLRTAAAAGAAGDRARRREEEALPSGRRGEGPLPDDGDLAPPEPARSQFGNALNRVAAYAHLLATEGVTRGLLGPRETPRLWERHILNSAAVGRLLPQSGVVLDLGSGAGLPGIVLAIMRPDLRFILLEANLRRATFLEECANLLGLTNATVRRARAENLAGEIKVDVVTARAVAPLDRLARWALPLLRPGGTLLAMKGDTAATEIEQAKPVLQRLGAQSTEIVTVEEEAHALMATVVVVRMVDRPE